MHNAIYSALSITVCATIALLGSLDSSAQTVQRLTADRTNEYALLYTLPSTAVDITLEIQLTQKTPGPFCNYARKYLAVPNPLTEEQNQVSLLSVTINTRAEANLSERYQVKFKAGSTPTMTLNELNAPLNVNTTEMMSVKEKQIPTARPAKPTALEDGTARSAMTPEMIQASSQSKVAQLASQRIYELREARNEIIAGQSDTPFPDGEAIKVALDNITAQETALTALFLGTEKTWTQVKTVKFVPDTANTDFDSRVIARISPTEGFVDTDDLSGTPVYLAFETLAKGTLPVNEKGITKTFPKGGLAYNIPGRGRLIVSYDGQDVAEAEIDVTQLGVTFGLDPLLFTQRKGTAYVVFNPLTGAIARLGEVKE